jgi:hypothetical protein
MATELNLFQNTHLKPITYEAYNRKLHLWLSLLPEGQQNIVFIYTTPNYSIVILRRYLVSTQSDTAVTLNSYIKAIMAAQVANHSLFLTISPEKMKSCDERWKELRQSTYAEAFAYRLEAQPSPLQSLHSGVAITFQDLVTKREELSNGSIHKLLLGFYSHIPPVRADYFATQILPFNEIPTSPNYIHHNSERSYLVITDFKTNKNYKQITHDLPIQLHSQLVQSLALYPRNYLFVNRFHKPFNRYTFSHWANQQLEMIFNKSLTLTMLRHLFISAIDFNNSTPAQLEAIGKSMGHRVEQQFLYKWKPISADSTDSNDSPDDIV